MFDEQVRVVTFSPSRQYPCNLPICYFSILDLMCRNDVHVVNDRIMIIRVIFVLFLLQYSRSFHCAIDILEIFRETELDVMLTNFAEEIRRKQKTCEKSIYYESLRETISQSRVGKLPALIQAWSRLVRRQTRSGS